MRTLVGCVAVLALAVSTAAVAQDKKIDGKLLLGKWSPAEGKKEAAMTLEFLKDGKLSLAAEIAGKKETIDGSYKLDGDKLDVALKFGGDEKKETLTIKELTDTKLETLDSKGKSDVFTRVKDEKKPAEKKPEEKKKAEEKKPAEKKAEEKPAEKKVEEKKKLDEKKVEEKKKP